VYGTIQRMFPCLGVTAIAASAVSRGYLNLDHVTLVVGGFEAFAAQNASIIGAAGAASIGWLACPKDVAACFASCRLGVFCAVNGSLCVSKLQCSLAG
jgi:hypothetical protein